MNRVLIIGASGLVGSACFEFIHKNFPYSLTGTYRNFHPEKSQLVQFDPFKNIDLLDENWDAVVHTAALTNVDLAETDPDKSYRETVETTKIILDRLLKSNPKTQVIYISTDYVFNGDHGPYFEYDQPDPINVYGRHKLACEKMVLDRVVAPAIVRVTNVYGKEERNKNFIGRTLNRLQNAEDVSVKVPLDQFATPVWSWDIARVVGAIISMKLTGIFHAAGSDYLNRYQLLKKIEGLHLPGKLELIPVMTADLGQAAPRPLRGGLICTELYKSIPDFEYSSISEFIR